MSEENEKKHYYQFSFVLQAPGVNQYVSQPIQLDTQQITVPVLRAVKKSMGISEQAIMLAATYLGHMTLAEFSPPARAGMDATEEYLEGLNIGISGLQANNPYPVGDVKNLDWRNGRIKGIEMREASEKAKNAAIGEIE